MSKITFEERLRYAFDNVMSKGTITLIVGLGLISLVVVTFLTLIVVILGIAPLNQPDLKFIDAFWLSLMRTLDPGTMGEDLGWGFRTMMFVVTLFGILMVSTLIGIVSRGILDRVEKLRKGRSFVVERRHILILGWSSKIHTIISELVIANENVKNPRIVILAEKDKVEMEDELKDKVGHTKNTKLICRSGNPVDIADLYIVNPIQTKSIIILDQETENSDSQIIKTILAITTDPDRRDKPYHITAEIKDPKNLEVAKMVGKDEVELILSDVFIALIMVQTGRQSGLSVVYTELLDFEGDEIYFNGEKKLEGKSFGEAIFAYKDSAIIGIHSAGEVKLNPPFDTIIQKKDKLIAITKDDDTMIVSETDNYNIDKEAITKAQPHIHHQEKILMLGWNIRSKIVILELDNCLVEGSKLKIVANYDGPKSTVKEIRPQLKNLSIEFEEGDITDKDILTNLEPTSYDHIMLQSNHQDISVQEADAQTLITLLHLRNLSDVEGKELNIVSEMLDIQNRKLAEVTKADDFIVSDNLLSLLMSQVSENKYLMQLFDKLFSSTESGIFILPVSNYVKVGQPVNYYTILESAKLKNQIAIGYRIIAHKNNVDKAYGVIINPVKSETIRFTREDKIIVLADQTHQ